MELVDGLAECTSYRSEERFGFVTCIAVSDRRGDDLVVGRFLRIGDARRDHHAGHATSLRSSSIALLGSPRDVDADEHPLERVEGCAGARADRSCASGTMSMPAPSFRSRIHYDQASLALSNSGSSWLKPLQPASLSAPYLRLARAGAVRE